MEIIFSIAIGILSASGTWLLLRSRTFQIIIGFSLISYAINLFIFGMGGLTIGSPPIINSLNFSDSNLYADPVPQALILTSIVINFAMTALFLVVILASRGFTGTDHVDGKDTKH
ncbi:MAG: Na+/H+ antiporter subunit C [Bordetella sp.]|nr:MAG: Na+/H+ antiporter subunit C [Bordetella sp.]